MDTATPLDFSKFESFGSLVKSAKEHAKNDIAYNLLENRLCMSAIERFMPAAVRALKRVGTPTYITPAAVERALEWESEFHQDAVMHIVHALAEVLVDNLPQGGR